MGDQKAIAYFRSSKPSEIPVELQRRRVQAYCKAMSYDLFSEITAEHPCTEHAFKSLMTRRIGFPKIRCHGKQIAYKSAVIHAE